MSNGKNIILHLIAGLIKTFGGDISVQVGLSNYATKQQQVIDTSKLATKPDLISLKYEVDKLNIEKLVPIPVDLSKTR